ncbi:MAG TPA: M48 family metalloprotease [Gammaproteobacteria bacterium]|nr:M48 family metalloprotease [Gammaproteobacteria bacterium]
MKRLVCLGLIAGQVLAGATAAADLPDFGSPADAVMNKTREGQLGRTVMMQLRNAGAVIDDPLVNEYINSLGSQLASRASNGDQPFHFFVVHDKEINAFALPGGYVGVNSGLLLATDNENELAAVLAHEVSHVTQRHVARSMYDSQRMSIVSMATMLAALLLGAASDAGGNAMAGILTASQAAALQRQINFTRANEQEADRIGMEVLSQTGFDPNAMADFFETLESRYGAAEQGIPEMLQTHPVTTSRIAEARARARQLPKAHAPDSTSYILAKARVEVLEAPTPEAALAAFQNKPDPDSPATRYGRALALTGMSRSDQAEREFRDLVRQSPDVIAYRIGEAEALAASGLYDQAIKVYEDAIRLFPRNVPLTVSYASVLINAGQAEHAHRLLLDLLNNVPPTPEQIRLIARAANAQGDTLNAYYYMGEYYVSTGNLPLAIRQLRMALEVPGAGPVERAKLNARLAELMDYLPKEQRAEVADATSRGPPQQ